MSKILYYSNYCNHCKKLLGKLSRNTIKDEVHFLCIDKRKKQGNNIFIILENGSEVLLPNVIKKVPSLLCLDKGNMLLEGEQIEELLMMGHNLNEVRKPVQNSNDEPAAFGMDQFGTFHNDCYSFLDQSADDLSAKGNGGMRQIHSYATLDFQNKIETPPDNYSPDKVGEVSLDQIQQRRAQEVQMPKRQM